MAYLSRPAIKKRAQAGVLQEANVDTAGLDPEMRSTLANEAARRLGAGGVQIRTRNPLDVIMGMFKRKPKQK